MSIYLSVYPTIYILVHLPIYLSLSSLFSSLKEKDKRIPLNYRGISLLSCAAKIYSSILCERVLNFFELNTTLVEEQNGFRKKRTCADHIFTLNSIVRNRMEEGSQTFAAFIDFQKAFDCVNHDFLYSKLINAGVDGKLYRSIKALYSCNRARVRLNNMYTDWFPCKQGLRQGDSLSPILFSLFINDLAEELLELETGVDVNNKNVSILLYADDIVLIAPSVENLQLMLNKMHSWLLKWHMNLNQSK